MREEVRQEVRRPVLLAGLLAQLSCSSCSLSLCEAAGGGRIWQGPQGENVCWQCRDPQLHTGLNISLMAVAEIILGGKYKYEEEVDEDEDNLTVSSSMDFTLKAPEEEEEEEENSLDFAEPALDSLVEVKQF